MKLRPVLLALAVIGIPLAMLVLALPISWGCGGYLYNPTNDAAYPPQAVSATRLTPAPG